MWVLGYESCESGGYYSMANTEEQQILYRQGSQVCAQLQSEVRLLWGKYTDKDSQISTQQKEIIALKYTIKDQKDKSKLQSQLVDVELVKKQEDKLKVEKRECQSLKEEVDTLLKFGEGNKQQNRGLAGLGGQNTIQQKLNQLRAQNKVLHQKIRDRDKEVMKQHTQLYGRRASSVLEEDSSAHESIRREIQVLDASDKQARQELQRQLQSVDSSVNRLKIAVEKKRLVFEQKMAELTKLKSKGQQRERIQSSIQRYKLRQREKLQRERLLKNKNKNMLTSENVLTTGQMQGLRDRTKSRGKSSAAELIEFMNQFNGRSPSSLLPRKPVKTFNSMGIGTTFYYNDTDYQ